MWIYQIGICSIRLALGKLSNHTAHRKGPKSVKRGRKMCSQIKEQRKITTRLILIHTKASKLACGAHRSAQKCRPPALHKFFQTAMLLDMADNSGSDAGDIFGPSPDWPECGSWVSSYRQNRSVECKNASLEIQGRRDLGSCTKSRRMTPMTYESRLADFCQTARTNIDILPSPNFDGRCGLMSGDIPLSPTADTAEWFSAVVWILPWKEV